jgi:peptide deformylase
MHLLRYPDPRLRRRAEPLPSAAFGTPGIERLGQALANALASLPEDERCDVLASTQVSFDPCWRVLALRTRAGIAVLCNPEITSYGEEAEEFESSVSFLCVPVRVQAPRRLVVQYRRVDGALRETECDPTGARAVWQGCESLEGGSVIDRLPVLGRVQFAARYRRKLDETIVVAAG